MGSVTIRVCGSTPTAYGNNGERDWRNAVAASAENYRDMVNDVNKQTEFRISIDFFLNKQITKEPDIDNLAVSTLNTLYKKDSRSNKKNGNSINDLPAGAPFPKCSDSQVVELHLKKIYVATKQQEGANIEINW
ncbi:MAG: hypothetical protein ACHQQQ_12360 [Bacteroidota bacterium]